MNTWPETTSSIISGSAILAALLMLFAMAGVCQAADVDVLHQYSTMNAYRQGLKNGEISLSEIKPLGELAIGMFNDDKGELVAFDNKYFYISPDGKTTPATDGMKLCFALVASFQTDRIHQVKKVDSLEELNTLMDKTLPTKNLFYSIIIEGKFTDIKTKSLHQPEENGDRAENTQTVFKLNNVEGCLMGFKMAPMIDCQNNMNYLWAFVSKDGKSGGLVVDASFNKLVAKINAIHSYTLTLPETEEFSSLDLEADEKHSVPGGNSTEDQ